jgi:hypothetical protein
MEPKYMPEDLQRGIDRAKKNIETLEKSYKAALEREVKLIAEYEFLKQQAIERIEREKREAGAPQ